jgi:hypothetical protein
MSQDRFGDATRRAFLGTATVATAATLAAPVAGEAQAADTGHPVTTTKLAEANADVPTELMSRAKASDWTKPAAMAIPKEGYFELEKGRYGAIFPKTPANYGFTIIAKAKPGRDEVIRAHGKTIENAIAGDPFFLAPLRLHYLRWFSSTSAAIRTLCTKEYSTPTLTNTLKTRLLFSAKRVLIPSSKILRAFRWIGRRTRRHSSNSCANINAQAFSNMVSSRSSPPTR